MVRWGRVFEDLPREHGFEPLQLEGRLPLELEGTLFRNGPARLTRFGKRYRHWFDGDGAVSAVRFAAGEAWGAVRLVQGTRPCDAGFGAPAVPLRDRLRGTGLKNAANTSVLLQDGRLFALYEAGLPTEISPDDLATLGETSFEGVVVEAFSAHPHRVAARGVTYGFGVRHGRASELDLYALPDSGRPRRLATVPLSAPTLVHDAIVSERHLVVFAPPVRFDLGALARGDGLAASMRWRPQEGTEVLVVPLDAPERPIRFFTEPFFQWHFANAYERGREIVVDLVRYPDLGSHEGLDALFRGTAPARAFDGRLSRAYLDPERRRLRWEERWDRPCEFPRVVGQVEGSAHRLVYLTAHPHEPSGPQDRLARVDVESGEVVEAVLGEASFVSEPVFAPRPGASAEDDGWLLALGYDPARHRTALAVFDARALAAGPLARAWFDHHIPPTFHGVWGGSPRGAFRSSR